jgi:hypothetical protein
MNLPAELTKAIQDFIDRRAWGQIQADFQRGRIVLIRKQETITTPDATQENNQHASTRSRTR